MKSGNCAVFLINTLHQKLCETHRNGYIAVCLSATPHIKAVPLYVGKSGFCVLRHGCI